MLDAKVLATVLDEGLPVEVWGVWIPRRGDNAIFSMEVVYNYGTMVTAELFMKDYDDAGDGSATGQSFAFDVATGRQSITQLGAKELVRVKMTLNRGDGLSVDDVGVILFRFLEPVWFESVKV
jgi:hypothetical protein